jgi:hypothetical protein
MCKTPSNTGFQRLYVDLQVDGDDEPSKVISIAFDAEHFAVLFFLHFSYKYNKLI